jgi:hypothetical protein
MVTVQGQGGMDLMQSLFIADESVHLLMYSYEYSRRCVDCVG